MAVPTVWGDISTTAASNPPAGGDAANTADDHLRQVYAFLRGLYEGSSNGQIAFPATQNASSGANTLDDYEEGDWTPTDGSGASLSFAAAAGRYIKVGKSVQFWGKVIYPTTSSSANAALSGLPFTSANVAALSYYSINVFPTFATKVTEALIAVNGTGITFYDVGAPTTNVKMTGLTVYVGGSYEAAA